MSKRHASGESNLLAQISGVAKALSFEAWALTSMKKNSYWKPLCHGFLGHVVIKNKKLLVNEKITALCQTNMTPKHYIKRCKQQKWKTVLANKFSKTTIAIRFSLVFLLNQFVHPCLLLYYVSVVLVRSFHVLISYFLVSLKLVVVLAVWILTIFTTQFL